MSKINIWLVALLLTVSFSVNAGTSVVIPDTDFTDWNWDDNSPTYWEQDGSFNRRITNPFNPVTQRTGQLAEVYFSGDYTKELGWELLWAQFNGTYPFFILYNRHKSIVRTFFYLEDIPFHHLMATLKMVDSNSPGVLTKGNKYQHSAEYYQSEDPEDLIAVVIPIVTPRGWCSADFPMVYDPNIVDYDSKRWEINFLGCDDYSMVVYDEAGKRAALKEQKALKEQHTIYGSSKKLFSDQFYANMSKFNSYVNTSDAQIKKFVESGKGINDSDPNFMQTYKAFTEEFEGVSKFVSTFSKGYGAVMSFIAFFNQFTGSTSDNSTDPVAADEGLYLKGSISIQKSLGATQIKVPGVGGNYIPAGLEWDPYDCPMGIFTMKRTPRVRRTTPYWKCNIDYDRNGYVYTWNRDVTEVVSLIGVDGHSSPLFTVSNLTDNNNMVPEKFYKYMLDEDFEVAIQEFDDMKFIDVSFAFVFEMEYDSYWNLDREYANMKFHDYAGREEYVPVKNPVYKALEDGRLKIFSVSDNGIVVGTPIAKMNELKGVVFEAPVSSKVGLKVIARFNSDIYGTIIQSGLYEIAPVTESAKRSVLYGTQEQQNFHWDGFFKDDSPITLTSAEDTWHGASKITLATGFIGRRGFVAELVGPYPTNGNTFLDFTNFNCSGSLKSDELSSFDNYEESSQSSVNDVIVYPSVTKGDFFISSKSKHYISQVDIVNENGVSIYNSGNILSSEVALDLSNEMPGVYFVNIICNSMEYQERIVVAR